jgi:molecular chaperone GrpE
MAKKTKSEHLKNKETVKEMQDEKLKDVEKEAKPEEKVELSQEEILQEKIELLENTVNKLRNDLLKEHADLENTRKRLEKERVIDRKYAAFGIAKKLIEPLDNFDIALAHQLEDETARQFVQGFKMIKNMIHKALEEEGVSEIDALGEPFDPNFHQAIMKEKQEGTDPNIVIEVLQKGYMFKDRIIRPAMVKISE